MKYSMHLGKLAGIACKKYMPWKVTLTSLGLNMDYWYKGQFMETLFGEYGLGLSGEAESA